MDGSLAFYLLILVAIVLGWFLPHSSSREGEGGPATGLTSSVFAEFNPGRF